MVRSDSLRIDGTNIVADNIIISYAVSDNCKRLFGLPAMRGTWLLHGENMFVEERAEDVREEFYHFTEDDKTLSQKMSEGMSV